MSSLVNAFMPEAPPVATEPVMTEDGYYRESWFVETFLELPDDFEAARKNEPYPLLYDSGVKYVREPPGSEVWQTPYHAIGTRGADCEDLSCWRAAELWALGETRARPEVRRISPRLRHRWTLRSYVCL